MQETHATNSTAEWIKITDITMNSARYTRLVLRAIMGICSCIVFYVLVCKRKRFEFPYVAIPICFLISGLIGVGIELFILRAEA